MRKSLFILLAITLFTTSCSDMIEKQLEIYEDAWDELEDVNDFPSLMNEALDTETRISYVVAKSTDEEINELKEEYEEKYEHMLDSVKTMRESYYSKVDRLFLEYTYNFVERRTLLYQMAADRYCKTEYIEELNAIKEVIKRYSKLSFVESQRSCDPPAKIREEYEAAKELADNCFDVAKKRILDKEKEMEEKE
jgi:hypothetical protein